MLLPDGQDPDDLLRAGGPSALAQALGQPLPLVDLLWMRETEAQPLDTPERRAGLERRLREVAGQIADETLRRHYQQELADRLARLLGRDRGGGAGGISRRGGGTWRGARRPSDDGPMRIGPASPIRRSFAASSPQSRPAKALILLILINHPDLLASRMDELATLDLPPPRLARCATRCCAGSRPTAASSARASPRLWPTAGLEDVCDAARGHGRPRDPVERARRRRRRADAAESLRQAFVLHRRHAALNRELRENRGQARAETPNEQDSARLSDIQAQLSALDGAEAAVEGFGVLRSGRRANL